MVLEEYGAAVAVELSAAQLLELENVSLTWKRALGLPRPPLSATAIRDGYAIRAEGVAGFIKIDGLSLEIKPKFLSDCKADWRAALWNVLALVEDQPTLGPVAVAGSTDALSLADLLGWAMLESIQRGILEGLPRGYVATSQLLPELRGQLDLSQIAHYVTRPYLLPCIFEEYRQDVPLNRLLLWALSTLAMTVTSSVLSRRLRDESLSFSDVGPIPPSMIEADRLQLSLQHQSLQVALDGSRLLLHRKHLSLAPVDLNAPTFLWNSAAVFERFVGRLLSQIFADDPESFVIRDSALLGQRSGCDGRVASALTTLPDYRIVHKGRTLIVLDAKYKLLGARYKPRNQDVYQVMAGGRVHNCAHVALVYPIEAGINRAPLTWFFEGGGMPTHLTAVFLPLELMALPDGFTILCRLLEKDIPLIRS